jgi:DnaJ-class molecular chaperone
MSKETRIQEYQERITKDRADILFCQGEIDELNGLTETCPHCNGKARFMTVHRMIGDNSYRNCEICRGKGKITKEDLFKYHSQCGDYIYDKNI